MLSALGIFLGYFRARLLGNRIRGECWMLLKFRRLAARLLRR